MTSLWNVNVQSTAVSSTLNAVLRTAPRTASMATS